MEHIQAGAIVDGKYKVLKSLGHGGMGEVYLARHVHLRENRVLKILRKDLVSDETVQKRFLREARLATQIKHSNVAMLHDFSRLPSGAFYMVSEYIEGTDVATWLAERGFFPLVPALQLGIQALRGLEAIHALGVVHRDISPDNLMLTRDSRGRSVVKIIDLGLARTQFTDPALEVTQAGTFMGKLKYCSPEQAEAENAAGLDRRSDLYSLALVLYEMICGLPPQEAKSPHALVVKRLTEKPLPLRGRNPKIDVPHHLDRILAKALSKARDDRYPTAIALIEVLDLVIKPLRELATQEVPVVDRSKVGPPDPARPKSSVSKELSREERRSLLSQIDQAAKRKRERTSAKLDGIERLIEAERFEEAREQISVLERKAPADPKLGALKERLQEAKAHDRASRELELEELYKGYLKNGQLAMAELGLQTLLEANPNHPKRSDFENWLEILREEESQRERVAHLLDQAREAAAEGDLRLAKKRLEKARQIDAEDARIVALESELEAAEESEHHDEASAQATGRLEGFLRDRKVIEAEAELARLEGLGASRASLDVYRDLLDEARSAADLEARSRGLQSRFEALLMKGDWVAAREIAGEVEESLGLGDQAAEMRVEVERREGIRRDQLAVEQGLAQIEDFLAAEEPDQAELALKVLQRVAPDFKDRRRLEKRIRALRKSLA